MKKDSKKSNQVANKAIGRLCLLTGAVIFVPFSAISTAFGVAAITTITAVGVIYGKVSINEIERLKAEEK